MTFTRGMNPSVLDSYTEYFGNVPYPDIDNTRASMGYAKTYANKMNLSAMTPRGDLTSTSYALADPGKEYLIYQPNTGSFTATLAMGTYTYEWYNPVVGAIGGTGSVSVSGSSQTFAPPFSGDAVLYLKNSALATQDTLAPSVSIGTPANGSNVQRLIPVVGGA